MYFNYIFTIFLVVALYLPYFTKLYYDFRSNGIMLLELWTDISAEPQSCRLKILWTCFIFHLLSLLALLILIQEQRPGNKKLTDLLTIYSLCNASLNLSQTLGSVSDRQEELPSSNICFSPHTTTENQDWAPYIRDLITHFVLLAKERRACL